MRKPRSPPSSLDRSHAPSSVFPPLTQPNTSSASLVSSTAQGRPIPLSDAKAADRTTALRELTRSQPLSHHRPANTTRTANTTSTTGPPNTTSATTSTTAGTYSHPVLVRTYSGPTSSSARRDALTGFESRPASPPSTGRRGRHGFAITLARPLAYKKPPHREEVKLPLLEDFTFKNILAEIEHDIGADLDRIADICARSRYSLSNQYEIHVTPHGSGDKFSHPVPSSMSTASPMPGRGGPTLQAVSIDDDRTTSMQSRRVTVRRRSVAYGTLETIISSSRSSDEDSGSKKKSAAEIAAQVRGQARGRVPPPSSERVDPRSTDPHASDELHSGRIKQELRARPTLAATIFDRSRTQVHRRLDPPSRRSDTTLVGEPVMPETSGGHLVSTTASEGVACGEINIQPPVKDLSSVSVVRLSSFFSLFPLHCRSIFGSV